MPGKIPLLIFVFMVIVLYAAALWFLGIPLGLDHAKPFAFTVTASGALLWLFDKLLWRIEPFQRIQPLPRIAGTWRVELHSTFVNPTDGKPSGAIGGFVSITQSYSNLNLKLFTPESSSKLIAYKFVAVDDDTFSLVGTYQSDPSIHLRGKVSEIHYGAFNVRLSGNPTQGMDGHYWTDRNTTGSIKYLERRDEPSDHFEAALQLFNKSAAAVPN
jgi:hypothetical protein